MLRAILTGAVLALGAPAAAVEVNADGLHVAPWIEETFLDLREDLAEAGADGRRLAIIVEQRGCIYCTRMHEEVFVDPEIAELLSEDFYVVRLNMHGALEATDFDGAAMEERELVRRWRNMFTPTMMFFRQDVPDGVTGAEAAVVTMPGAFERGTMLDLLTWVLEEGHDGEEDFQRYHARMVNARRESGN
ncbi:MAG: thioredoxin family protein [Roseicyclus sp.]